MERENNNIKIDTLLLSAVLMVIAFAVSVSNYDNIAMIFGLESLFLIFINCVFKVFYDKKN